jgi:hypothetical protein
MRFEVPSIKFRGAIAQAMAKAYERRDRLKDVSSSFPCTWCPGTVKFTTLIGGKSYGRCSSNCGVKWSE